MRNLIKSWFNAMMDDEIAFQRSLTMEQRIALNRFQAMNNLNW